MKNLLNYKIGPFLKSLKGLFVVGSVIFLNVAFAADGAPDLGTVAQNVTSTFDDMAKLITASSYIAGLGFAIGAILKFKAHKDNPQQVTVGTPIALMFVAAALIFLPSMFDVAGQTLFGGSQSYAGVTGITDF